MVKPISVYFTSNGDNTKVELIFLSINPFFFGVRECNAFVSLPSVIRLRGGETS